MNDNPIIVYTAINDKNTAQSIAKKLIENKCSPCINIINHADSVYKWNNQIEYSREYLIIIKTFKSKFREIEKLITKYHPYEVPELISVNIEDINDKYLSWMLKNK